MKALILALLLAGCAHIQPASDATAEAEEPEEQTDLGRLIAKVLSTKEKVVIKQQSKRVIQLCKMKLPGAYDDSALEEAVRTMAINRGIMEDCANKQLRGIAKEFNLEIRE